MIRKVTALAMVALFAVTGFRAWDHYVNIDHPEALLMTEEVLATDGLVALGSVSIEHAVRLEAAFMGAPETAGASAHSPRRSVT